MATNEDFYFQENRCRVALETKLKIQCHDFCDPELMTFGIGNTVNDIFSSQRDTISQIKFY